MLSLYQEGRTPVHALPAGVKLLVLFLAGTLIFLIRDVAWLAAAMAVVGLCYVLARIPWRPAVRSLVAVVPFAAITVIAQIVLSDWVTGVVVGERILTTVGLANLVTLTTRTEDMIATIETAMRPAVPLGIRPERIGLVVAIAIRFIPMIKEQTEQVRAAQRARGVERSVAFLTPLLIKILRLADGLGEALDARGVDAPGRRERDPRPRRRGARRT
jgi:biotin transport system permease protein